MTRLWRSRNVKLVVLSLMTAHFLGSRATRAAEAPAPDEVATSIARGVSFLRGQQGRDGHWSYAAGGDHSLGMTALAGLALLESGAGPDDEAVGRAGEVVRTLARSSNQTYDLSLAILFLARVQGASTGPNDPLIRRLARRLSAGERGGMWTYHIPVDRRNEDDDASESSNRSPVRALRRLPRGMFGGDNSNTQFALLGLWAAGRHGFDPSPELEAIDGHFRSTLDSRGGWGYVPGDPPRDAMTCAGLMGLTVAAARPVAAERQTAKARGAALAADPAFLRALQAVVQSARGIDGESDIYYLWSLERVCVALGLRDLDGFDWYAAGARELLRRQRADGGWPEPRWGSLPNTCLALLFLRKANLAFEIDRVLRLPGRPRDDSVRRTRAQNAFPDDPPDRVAASASAGTRVVITGASDRSFPEIAVDFEVRRPDDSFVIDARRDDFRVTEDGQPVEILKFSSPVGDAPPITVVLVVDRSLSMQADDRIDGLKQAVATFTEGLPRGSRVAVIAFGSDVVKLCPFTEDPARVRQLVGRLTPAGATRYYDAVEEALQLLQGETGRRAVLALTDGEDTFSQSATLESVTATARRLGLPVHTLGLGSDDEIASDDLRQLAQETRGQYYPARQADQLRTIYRELATRLRSSYTLVYRSERRIPDGTLRPVRVAYLAGGKIASAGETSVFIPGMVVPASGWSRLLALLLGILAFLSCWPPRRATSHLFHGNLK